MMRDIVIAAIFAAAEKNSDIVFMSADLGAPALDRFRENLPDQFIFAGISEQNMIDVAAGLALSGKTVFCYAMAPFITARCYEQTKCSLAAMSLPVTLIGVGVGLGYDDASMTHYAFDDIALMRALNGIEIVTPCDDETAAMAIQLMLECPRFCYLRLDRYELPPIHDGADYRVNGMGILADSEDVVIVACGNMVHKAMHARDFLLDQSESWSHGVRRLDVGVIDLHRIKPLGPLALALRKYDHIVTVEEHVLEGGLGSVVAEVIVDNGLKCSLKRLGLADGFKIVNGNREELHAYYHIDTKDIVDACL